MNRIAYRTSSVSRLAFCGLCQTKFEISTVSSERIICPSCGAVVQIASPAIEAISQADGGNPKMEKLDAASLLDEVCPLDSEPPMAPQQTAPMAPQQTAPMAPQQTAPMAPQQTMAKHDRKIPQRRMSSGDFQTTLGNLATPIEDASRFQTLPTTEQEPVPSVFPAPKNLQTKKPTASNQNTSKISKSQLPTTEISPGANNWLSNAQDPKPKRKRRVGFYSKTVKIMEHLCILILLSVVGILGWQRMTNPPPKPSTVPSVTSDVNDVAPSIPGQVYPPESLLAGTIGVVHPECLKRDSERTELNLPMASLQQKDHSPISVVGHGEPNADSLAVSEQEDASDSSSETATVIIPDIVTVPAPEIEAATPPNVAPSEDTTAAAKTPVVPQLPALPEVVWPVETPEIAATATISKAQPSPPTQPTAAVLAQTDQVAVRREVENPFEQDRPPVALPEDVVFAQIQIQPVEPALSPEVRDQELTHAAQLLVRAEKLVNVSPLDAVHYCLDAIDYLQRNEASITPATISLLRRSLHLVRQVSDENQAGLTAAAMLDGSKELITADASGQLLLWAARSDCNSLEPLLIAEKQIGINKIIGIPKANQHSSSVVRFITFTQAGHLKVWHLDTKKRRAEPILQAKRSAYANAQDAAVSPDGQWLLIGCRGNEVGSSAHLLPLGANATVNNPVTLEGHRCDIVRVAFTHNSKNAITADARGEIRVWTIGNDASVEQTVLHKHNARIDRLITTKNGLLISTDVQSRIQLWRFIEEQGQLSIQSSHLRLPVVGRRINGLAPRLTACDIDARGALVVASTDDGNTYLWNAAIAHRDQEMPIQTMSMKIDTTFRNDCYLTLLRFTPNGDRLVGVGNDMFVRTWSRQALLKQRLPEETFPCVLADVSELLVTADDELLFAADTRSGENRNASVQLWTLGSSSTFLAARQFVAEKEQALQQEQTVIE